LELAFDPAYPQALQFLLGRVRAEALERAYPEVTVHAPIDHPAIEAVRAAAGRVYDQESVEGTVSMYHITDLKGLLKCILPELTKRAIQAGCPLPVELGVTSDEKRWLIHVNRRHSKVEPDKLSRRHLTLSAPALVRLVMGHTGIDAASDEEGFVASTSTALDAARALFPTQPIWRSPLDSATA
jgi:hypothetical protein